MRVEARVVDFRDAKARRVPEGDIRPRTSEGRLTDPKQVRARVRRKISKGQKISEEEFEIWAGKPIDQWDLEELSRGRPRDARGGFRGRPPLYMPRAVHERITDRFKLLVRNEMNVSTAQALGVISSLLSSEELDDKGKPIVPAGTKLDAAKWLVEHVIGKPVQPTQTDISVKLQSILGTVMVNPVVDDNHPDQLALPRGYTPAHRGSRGEAIDVDWWEDPDD
ncbi:hypothetical protein ACWIG4_30190 [Streptomyces sp. NPDC002248]